MGDGDVDHPHILGHPKVSGDSFGCHSWGKAGGWIRHLAEDPGTQLPSPSAQDGPQPRGFWPHVWMVLRSRSPALPQQSRAWIFTQPDVAPGTWAVTQVLRPRFLISRMSTVTKPTTASLGQRDATAAFRAPGRAWLMHLSHWSHHS